MKQILAHRRRMLIALTAIAAVPALAADEERRVPVKPEPGKTRSFEDEISEYEVVVYVIPLQQGQTLQALLTSTNSSNCFDIYAPGIAKPVYVGSDSGSSAKLVATTSGEYLVKVFLLRLAARDGQSARYILELKAT